MKSSEDFVEGLKKQGYSVKYNVSLKGTSGVKHHADVVAEHSNGKKVVGLRARGKETAAEIIGTFVVALDTKAEAFFVVEKALDKESRKLAESYEIKVLTGAR